MGYLKEARAVERRPFESEQEVILQWSILNYARCRQCVTVLGSLVNQTPSVLGKHCLY